MSDELAEPLWLVERRGWATGLFGARSSRVARTMLAMLLFGLVALLAWLLLQAVEGQHALEVARAGSEDLRTVPPKRVLTPIAKPTPYQMRTLGKVIDRLNVPWPLLMDDLERHTPPTVAILRLEPDVNARSVNMLVEARKEEDVFRYVDALKSAHSLSGVRVVRYEINVQDVARPARFMLVARMGGDRHVEAPESAPVPELNPVGGTR